MFWEIQFIIEIDEEQLTITEEYNSFEETLTRFNELVREEISAVIVYSHIEGYPISPVLAFSNDWEQSFIHDPDWVD